MPDCETLCVVCGNKFLCRRISTSLYCSSACSQKAYRKRHRVQLFSICSVCKNEFSPKRKSAKYCSPACAQKAHRERVNRSKMMFGPTAV